MDLKNKQLSKMYKSSTDFPLNNTDYMFLHEHICLLVNLFLIFSVFRPINLNNYFIKTAHKSFLRIFY